MAMIPCRLQFLLYDDQRDHIVFLQEINGQRRLQFVIGAIEATAIIRHLKGEHFSRPLTHDLLDGVCTALGGQFFGLRIVRAEQGTYFAELLIRGEDGTTLAIDCRPSDGLAVMTRHGANEILVDESLLAV